MAVIVKRNNKFRALVSVPNRGEYKRLTKTFPTYQEAKVWGLKLELQKSNGVDLMTRDTLLVDYFSYHLEFVKKAEVKESTYLAYKRQGEILRKLFPKIRIRDLNDVPIQTIINDYASNHALKTVQLLVTPLRSVLKYAYAHGLLVNDISSLIHAHGNVPKKRNRALSITELKKLRHYCFEHTQSEFAILVLLATDSGLRRGEILGLKPDDLSEEAGECDVQVNRSLSPFSDAVSLKTESSRRKVSITKPVYDLVKMIPVKADGYIFERDGFHQSMMLAPFLAKVGISQTTFHGLRDTHASFLFSQNLDLAYISQRLGHSSLLTTQNYYITLMPEKKHAQNGRAMDLLAGL
ncbi:tyrosine-type recombinase/integrase [Lacticaseibacillus paracasei]|uniref:Site-specific integrase n=1 Tax=Lacticaseibacillus paracasei TaxID=1597 RepID=A0AAP4JHQ9_LACPA|nr:site-specific integrase [Lacticaseibacillus paracasei]MDM7452825.1 site-specific integrase [Lacticaseibacillus paracasei]MDM7470014.1 site-specific integrase [Lacticaseibacillus paracasei]